MRVNIPSKNAEWKNKFLYFQLPTLSQVQSRWNLGRIFDRLDDSLVIPSFDILEGSGRRRKLLGNLSEFTLVQAALSQAQLSEKSEDEQSQDGSPSASHSDSQGPSLGTTMLLFYF